MKRSELQQAEHDVLNAAAALDPLRIADILLTAGCYDEGLLALWKAARRLRSARGNKG